MLLINRSFLLKNFELNAQFQRIVGRDKKAFLNEQCKVEENNKMGKTRDLFKKIGDINGIFHARMGMIKDRNCKDQTEAKEFKKRWQEYPEELYKKGIMTRMTTMVWSLT